MEAAQRNRASVAVSEPVESVVSQVMNVILGLILSGELPPGEPATIRDLSKRLGVSHIPVREALRGLESKGLVTFRRGKGMQIAPVSHEDLQDVFQLREAIESAVAGRTTGKFGPEQLQEVERQFDRLRLSFSGGDAFAVTVAHRAFHFALLPEATPWDKRILDQVWTASERYLQIFLRSREDARDLAIESHAELVTAARTMAPEELRASIIEHITSSVHPIATAVSARSQDAAGS